MTEEQRKVPALRFAGFTGDWVEKKLEKILTVNSGKDYKGLGKGSIPVYGTGGYILSVDDKLSDEDAVGIGRKGTIDKPFFLKAPFWTVYTLFYLTSKPGNDIHFILQLANMIKWKKYDESTGVPSLSKVNINKITIGVLNLEEQTKIADTLTKLDTTISLQ